jgi:GGDEF domain-containing protein
VNYTRFEWITLVIGGTAIGGTLVASFSGGTPIPEEIVAQVMLFGVLAAALHWGRSGGSMAAFAATVVYTIMRVPAVLDGGLTGDIAVLVLMRAAAYGLLGIVGGEAFGRLKYFLARVENSTNVDPDSLVFNERFTQQLLLANIGRHTRYGTPFALVLISVDPGVWDQLRIAKKRSMIAHLATHVRNDVRLVDDVGRLNDGRFILVLPHTPKDGALVAGERVRAGLCKLLGSLDETVTSQILAAPEDLTAIQAFAATLEAPSNGHNGSHADVPVKDKRTI